MSAVSSPSSGSETGSRRWYSHTTAASSNLNRNSDLACTSPRPRLARSPSLSGFGWGKLDGRVEPVMSRFAAPLAGWWSDAGAWARHARESVHSWTVVPLSLAAVTLAGLGFWIGSVTGTSGGGAGAATTTIRVHGQ